MSLRAPGRRFVSWLARRRARHGVARALPSFSAVSSCAGASRGRRSPAAGLSLTSLIDVMVVIVVYLLLSFSASGENCACRRELNLPTAEHPVDLIDAPLVSVTEREVLVDGIPVEDSSTLSDGRVHRLERMFNLLKAKRALAKELRPAAPAPSHVILAIDSDVPASIVKSVSTTAARSGYASLDFMVNAGPRVD